MPRKGNKNNQAAVSRTQLRKTVHGSAFTPAAHPATIRSQPWFRGVLHEQVYLKGPGKNTYFGGAAFGSIINARWGITNNVQDGDKPGTYNVLAYRTHSIRVWEMTGESLGFVLAVNDLARDPKNDHLASLRNSPAENQWARCGYLWPAAHQTFVLSTDEKDEDRPVFQLVNPAGISEDTQMKYLLHWEVSWKVRDTHTVGLISDGETIPFAEALQDRLAARSLSSWEPI